MQLSLLYRATALNEMFTVTKYSALRRHEERKRRGDPVMIPVKIANVSLALRLVCHAPSGASNDENWLATELVEQN